MPVFIRNDRIEKQLKRLQTKWFKGTGRKGSMAKVAETLILERLEQIKAEKNNPQ